jgi:hypothetical protein
MAYSFNRNHRLYAAVESSFGTAATLTGANCFLITKATFTPNVDLLVPQSKTGTRTQPVGVAGRRTAKFTIEIELRTSGTAGTKPDIDPLLVATFGQAGTVVASTSVTYNLSDLIPSLTIGSYRTPASAIARSSVSRFSNSPIRLSIYAP